MQQFWNQMTTAITSIGTILGIYLTQKNISKKTDHDVMQDNLNDVYKQLKEARTAEQMYHDKYNEVQDTVDKLKREILSLREQMSNLKIEICRIKGDQK